MEICNSFLERTNCVVPVAELALTCAQHLEQRASTSRVSHAQDPLNNLRLACYNIITDLLTMFWNKKKINPTALTFLKKPSPDWIADMQPQQRQKYFEMILGRYQIIKSLTNFIVHT